LEGGVQIVKGVGNVISKTVSGTFGTVGNMTESLASGLSSLSMNEDFILERESRGLNKPKNVFDGLGQGAKSIAKGIGHGIMGVIKRPMEGAGKEGMKGFVKGTFKGVAGLIVTPIAGLVDATSKTAEGFRSTTMLQMKPFENRIRQPRVFYGKEYSYREYKAEDANLNYILYNMDKKYRDLVYFGIYLLNPQSSGSETNSTKSSMSRDTNEKTSQNEQVTNSLFFFLITQEYVMLYNVNTEKLEWVIETAVLTNFVLNDNEIELFVEGIVASGRRATMMKPVEENMMWGVNEKKYLVKGFDKTKIKRAQRLLDQLILVKK